MLLKQLNKSDFTAIYEVAVKSFYVGAMRHLYTKEEYFLNTYDHLSRVFDAEDVCFLGLYDRNSLVAVILGYGTPSMNTYYCPMLWVAKGYENLRHGTTLASVLYKQAIEKNYVKFIVETPTNSSALKRMLPKMGFHRSRIIWSKVVK